jgi:hypothetical protein
MFVDELGRLGPSNFDKNTWNIRLRTITVIFLFFQKNNIMRFKNRFQITANGPLSAILRSFV